MENFKIYWNNICLLRKKEEEFINSFFRKESNYNFDITYFGLGMPLKLKSKIVGDLEENSDINADLVISTELDIFWDKNILGNKDIFKNLKDTFDIKDYIKNSNVLANEKSELSAFLLLPELICVNTLALNGLEEPLSLKDLTLPKYKGRIVIGGKDTAAGRIIAICIWYLYGLDYLLKFMDNVNFVKVPAMALGLLKKGAYPIGILPSILAGRDLKTIFPSDGIPVIPTYAVIHKNANYILAKKFLDFLLGEEFQEFYSSRGYLLPANKNINYSKDLYPEKDLNLLYPAWDFIMNFDIKKFYEIMDSPETSFK
ncbi:MAG: ABC transporter substrate-binding protein [Acholeplasmatales bacterium]|jgi:ABC-type Fe3+ transport system substrate-binding protein|nr:ABC transporter substrate-binding protein [Acholeplasmatales bacterium]